MSDAQPITFHTRVDAALADSALQQALSTTMDRLTANRTSAFAALPDAEAKYGPAGMG